LEPEDDMTNDEKELVELMAERHELADMVPCRQDYKHKYMCEELLSVVKRNVGVVAAPCLCVEGSDYGCKVCHGTGVVAK
jgi:hypothetical protein